MKTMRKIIIQNFLRFPKDGRTNKHLTYRQTANIALASRMFNIQNVHDFTSKVYTQSSVDGMEIDDFVLKLPYEATIFEFESRALRDETFTMQYGVVCAMANDNTLIASVVVRASSGNLLICSIFKFKLNEDGTPINSKMKSEDYMALVEKIGLDKVKEFGEFKEVYGESCFSHMVPGYQTLSKDEYLACLTAGMDAIVPVLYALNLLNCKNVRQTEHTTHDKLTKRERKSLKAPEYQEYRMLDVPLINKIASGEITVEDITGGGKIPLHTVRGHCKTYTADKPLLGKHVGRWYWGPTLRGKLSNGIIQKEYRTTGQPSGTSGSVEEIDAGREGATVS